MTLESSRYAPRTTPSTHTNTNTPSTTNPSTSTSAPTHTQTLPKLTLLLHRIHWKSTLLLHAHTLVPLHSEPSDPSDPPGSAGSVGEDAGGGGVGGAGSARTQWMIDIAEWYTLVEKLAVMALGVWGVVVPRVPLSPSSVPGTQETGVGVRDGAQEREYGGGEMEGKGEGEGEGEGEGKGESKSFFGTGPSRSTRARILGTPREETQPLKVGEGVLTGGEELGRAGGDGRRAQNWDSKERRPWTHAYHENLLLLLERPEGPLYDAFGDAKTMVAMRKAKGLRNGVKGVLEGSVDKAEGIMGEAECRSMLEAVFTACERAVGIVKDKLVGGERGVEEMEWEGVGVADVLGLGLGLEREMEDEIMGGV